MGYGVALLALAACGQAGHDREILRTWHMTEFSVDGATVAVDPGVNTQQIPTLTSARV